MRLEVHLLGVFGGAGFLVVWLFWVFFVRSKSKWLVLKMFFCLKTANVKMLNIQYFGLRLAEAGRFF